LYLVIGDETNSFAQLVFLFSLVWQFRQQSDSAREPSRHSAHGSSLIAKQVGYSILLQRVRRLPAFLQA
jgi:hypothetical protein